MVYITAASVVVHHQMHITNLITPCSSPSYMRQCLLQDVSKPWQRTHCLIGLWCHSNNTITSPGSHQLAWLSVATWDWSHWSAFIRLGITKSFCCFQVGIGGASAGHVMHHFYFNILALQTFLFFFFGWIALQTKLEKQQPMNLCQNSRWRFANLCRRVVVKLTPFCLFLCFDLTNSTKYNVFPHI